MDNWRKSSYSGEGDGNECVEIATSSTHIAIRDSKAPTALTLTFPAVAFTTFIEALRWRKSSHSGPDDGNACVEIATAPTHIAVRDSKTPATGTLTFQTEAFAPFLATVRNYSTVTDFARFRG